MTVTEARKYKKYINEIVPSINIDERDLNIWCDVIEMLCFINKDKVIFREDIERELEGLVDGGIQLAALKEISQQMGFDLDDNHIFSNNGTIDWGSDDSSRNDLLNQITNMWFNHLKQRQISFGYYYPFKVNRNLSEISCKTYSQLTKKNKLYLYFTLASKRKGLSRAQQKRLEFDFEPIAFESFKSLLPTNGVAFLIGKGSYTADLFKSNKYNKFKLLASKLKTNLRVSDNYFRPRDSGENGIDFIGWLTYNDDLPNNHVYAGQATCMKDWETKYNESSKKEMGGILDTSKIGSYTNALFIPYHFKLGHDWAKPSYVVAKDYVLFDRYRILMNLNVRNINNRLIPTNILQAIA
jgi:hypothetical protein